MIDTHCHLEQPQFDKDRDQVIDMCRKGGLLGIVTSCARVGDLELSLGIKRKHDNFVFLTAGIHPEFIRDVTEKDIERFMDWVREHREEIVGIGECGLDYHWVKEEKWQAKQRDLFNRMLDFAGEVNKPVIVHSRNASLDTIKMLETFSGGVQWHMFTDRKYLARVMENDWMISINTLILRSKDVKKIARDMPLERILLETDSPWLGQEGKRNTPLAIREVAEKIADMKKLTFEEVWEACGRNALDFLKLPISFSPGAGKQ